MFFNAGSNGAAIATLVSQLICFVSCYIYFNKKYSNLKFNINHIQFNMNIFTTSLKIGLPAAAQKFLIASGYILIQILTNSFGTSVIAGFASASKIDSFAQLPSSTLSDALSVFTSQNIGAKKTSRIKKGFKSTFLISAVICLSITLICILFSSNLIKLFISDLLVVEIGSKYIKTVSLFYIIFSAMIITNGLLLGFGNSLVPLFGTILSFLCFQVPVSLFLSKSMGPAGIYVAMPGGWIIGLLLRLYFVIKTFNNELNLKTNI